MKEKDIGEFEICEVCDKKYLLELVQYVTTNEDGDGHWICKYCIKEYKNQ